MSSIPFDIYVFDFDGTLVDSAAAKRQAFFDTFPAVHAPAIEAALASDPDGSRFAVIPKIVEEIELRGLPEPPSGVAALLEAYASRAVAAASGAPEVPGATAVLRTLSERAAVYVASVTPHDQLWTLLRRRGWLAGLAGAFGYPNRKSAVIAALLARHGVSPDRLLVVGDGVSDAEAAARNGCPLHRIEGPSDLLRTPGLAAAPIAAVDV